MKETRDINGLRFHEVCNVQSEQRQNEVKVVKCYADTVCRKRD